MLQSFDTKAPQFFLRWLCRHSTDWFLISEDLPLPENRLRVEASGRVVFDVRRPNWPAHMRLVARMKRHLRAAGYPFIFTGLSISAIRPTSAARCAWGSIRQRPRSTLVPQLRPSQSLGGGRELPAHSAGVNPTLTVLAQPCAPRINGCARPVPARRPGRRRRSEADPRVNSKMPKHQHRSIGVEILEGIRQLKRGEVGRGQRLPSVRAAREQVGLSQSEFARLLGVSDRTLQEWEQGRRIPSGPAKALLTIAYQNPKALWRLRSDPVIQPTLLPPGAGSPDRVFACPSSPIATPASSQRICEHLTKNDARNAAICSNVNQSIGAGRAPLVLTERVDHLEALAGGLRAIGASVVLLRGGMGNKPLKAALAQPPSMCPARYCWQRVASSGRGSIMPASRPCS